VQPLGQQRAVAAQEADPALAQLDNGDIGRLDAVTALRPHERAHAARPGHEQLGRQVLRRFVVQRCQHSECGRGAGRGVARARDPRIQESTEQRNADRAGNELAGAERGTTRAARTHGGQRDDRAERERQHHTWTRQPDPRERTLYERDRLCIGAAREQQPHLD
jgi:hypothetical protein